MILNYTTEVPSSKTLGEIQTLLAKSKCQAIMTEFDDNGQATAVNFRIKTPSGVMSFRLPCNTQKIYQVLCREAAPRYRTRSHAERVAWRIVKDWLEAQLAIIRSEMVDFEQAFLPYAQGPTGETLYETLKGRSFDLLALPAA